MQGSWADFSLKSRSTLDKRVHSERWPRRQVPAVHLGWLLTARQVIGPVFLKIDTLGSELTLLRGLEDFLTRALNRNGLGWVDLVVRPRHHPVTALQA